MRYNLQATLIFSVFVVFIPATATAQLKPLPIAKASDLIESHEEIISVGSVVTFRARPTMMAEKSVRSGIQARVFALRDRENNPHKLDTIDDCNIYLSSVFPLQQESNGTLIFGKVDEGWLNPSSSGKSIKDGRYFIVFEKLGAAAASFGIRSLDADQYFSAGFVITVRNDGSAVLDKVLAEYNKREIGLSELRLATDKGSTPCYTFTKLANTSEAEQGLFASQCAKESTSNPPV